MAWAGSWAKKGKTMVAAARAIGSKATAVERTVLPSGNSSCHCPPWCPMVAAGSCSSSTAKERVTSTASARRRTRSTRAPKPSPTG